VAKGKFGQALALYAYVLRYAFVHRPRLYATQGRRPKGSPRRFALTVLRRFRDLNLDRAEPFQFVLANELWRTHDYSARVPADRRGALAFRLATGLKASGWFEDAELLLREVARRPAYADLAWLCLGDLFLVEANWAEEFAAYEAIGAVIDAYALSDDGPGWQSRRLAEAAEAFRHAITVAPHDPHAWLLLATTERRRGRWSSAEHAARAFDARHPAPAWDDRMVQVSVAMGRDHESALRICEAARATQIASLPDGGFESWAPRIVDVRPARRLAALERREALPATCLELNAGLVRSGVASEYRRQLAFAAADVTRFADITVLPNHGMLLAGDETLLGDSAHVLPRDFPLFTPDVRAVVEGHGMLCGPPAVSQPEASGGIFLGENANYYHFLIDELPRLQLLEGSPDYADRPLIIDSRTRAWQVELLRRVGYPDERLKRLDLSGAVRLEDVVVPGRLSGRMLAHPDAVRYLRAKLAPHADRASPRPGKRVYLSRPDSSRRGMLNQPAVFRRLKHAGFVSVEPGAMTIDQQIEFFADVEVMAGPGGAAFTNLVFAPRGAKALFLTPPDVAAESFTSIASALGQTAIWCAGSSYPRPYPAWIWSIFDSEIDLNDLEIALQLVL
jgi:hypothetical protein